MRDEKSLKMQEHADPGDAQNTRTQKHAGCERRKSQSTAAAADVPTWAVREQLTGSQANARVSSACLIYYILYYRG